MRRLQQLTAALTLAALIAGCGSAPATTPEEPHAEEQTADETETAPEPEPEPAPEKPDLSALPLNEYLSAMIVEETGDSTYWVGGNVPRIRKDGLMIMNGDSGQYASLMLNADDSLTAAWIRTTILDYSTRIFRRLYTEREDAPEKTVIQWYFIFEDVYGDVTEEPIITVSVSRDTAARFNWDRFNYTDLPEAADSYVEHPSLSQ